MSYQRPPNSSQNQGQKVENTYFKSLVQENAYLSKRKLDGSFYTSFFEPFEIALIFFIGLCLWFISIDQ